MPINQDLRTKPCFHALQGTDLSAFIPHRKFPASNAWRPYTAEELPLVDEVIKEILGGLIADTPIAAEG